MGRAPCCDKAKVKRGPWSPEEDATLKSYLQTHGSAGNWIALPTKAGLKRCGKSCRLRWLNYLRPDIKHGGFTEEEDHTICNLYNQMGSRWSVIASQLPGRTDNDVKNYWNTKLKKKLLGGKINIVTQIHNNHNNNYNNSNPISLQPHISRLEPNEPISSFQKSTTLSMLTDINNNYDQKLTSFLYDHHQLFSPRMFMELLSDDQYQHFDNNNNNDNININNNANHVTHVNHVPSLSQDHQPASGTTTTTTTTAATSDHSSSVDVKPRGGRCNEFGGPTSTEFCSDLAYNFDIIDGERAAFAPSYNSLGNNYYFC